MENSFLTLKPNVVSESFSAHSTLVYGSFKTGKTRVASEIDDNVILSLEQGGSCIAGGFFMPITTWQELELKLMELRDPRVKERFKNITIDTGDQLVALAQKKVLDDYNTKLRLVAERLKQSYTPAESFSDINDNGKNYPKVDELILSVLTTIRDRLGYGLLVICHSKEVTDSKGYKKTTLNMSDRYQKVFNAMIDSTGFVRQEFFKDANGNEFSKPIIYFRETREFYAGSRFHCIRSCTDFTAKDIENAYAEALELEKKMLGENLFTKELPPLVKGKTEEEDFAGCMQYLGTAFALLQSNYPDSSKQSFSKFWLPLIKNANIEVFGEERSLAALTVQDLGYAKALCHKVEEIINKYA